MLKDIAAKVGTNRTRVREYIEKNNIPHNHFRSAGHSGSRNGRWKGGVMIDKDGYVMIKDKSHPFCNRHGYVREHRLVMEKELGRYLSPSEVVHHLDGNKQNNDPSNLEIFPTNSEHLAETLQGKVPNWTPEGYQRILAGVQKSKVKRRKSTPTE